MIDFNYAKNAFDKYLESYDKDNESVRLKITHTYEVVKKSEYIAKKLSLDEENIQLAKVIALLHDIGRFEQIKETGSFLDKKFDHAVYGVSFLFSNGTIRKFVSDDTYDLIIKKAILNHNRLAIEDGLSEQCNLHCKIIRDADKLDNFRVRVIDPISAMFPDLYDEKTYEYGLISPVVFNDFMDNKCIKLNDRKSLIDYWICIIAFIFDLNFNVSLEYVVSKNYIDKLIDRIDYKNVDTKNKMELIRKCAKNYLNDKINRE